MSKINKFASYILVLLFCPLSKIIGQVVSQEYERVSYNLLSKKRTAYWGGSSDVQFSTADIVLFKLKLLMYYSINNSKDGLILEPIHLGRNIGSLPDIYNPFNLAIGHGLKYQRYISKRGGGSVSEFSRLSHFFIGLEYNYSFYEKSLHKGYVSTPLGVSFLVNGNKSNRICDTYLSPQFISNWGHYKLLPNTFTDDFSYSGSVSLIFIQHLHRKYNR
jgi:hypothetical protein